MLLRVGMRGSQLQVPAATAEKTLQQGPTCCEPQTLNDLPEPILSFALSFLHGFNVAGWPAAACRSLGAACADETLCQQLFDRDFEKEDFLGLPLQPIRFGRTTFTFEALHAQGRQEHDAQHAPAASASVRIRSFVNELADAGAQPLRIGHDAARQGRPALLQWASSRCDLDHIDRELSALMVAAVHNHPRTTAVATTCCSLDQHNGRFGTALHQAAYNGASASVRELVRAGADLVTRNQTYEQTPLHVACSRNHAEVVGILIDARSDPLDQDKDGLNALRIAEVMRSDKVLAMLTEGA